MSAVMEKTGMIKLRWELIEGPMHSGMQTEWGYLGVVQVASVHVNASRAADDLEKVYAGTVLLPGFTQDVRNAKGPTKEWVKQRMEENVSEWCRVAGVVKRF